MNINNYTSLLNDNIFNSSKNILTKGGENNFAIDSKQNYHTKSIGCVFYHNFEILHLKNKSFYPIT